MTSATVQHGRTALRVCLATALGASALAVHAAVEAHHDRSNQFGNGWELLTAMFAGGGAVAGLLSWLLADLLWRRHYNLASEAVALLGVFCSAAPLVAALVFGLIQTFG